MVVVDSVMCASVLFDVFVVLVVNVRVLDVLSSLTFAKDIVVIIFLP